MRRMSPPTFSDTGISSDILGAIFLSITAKKNWSDLCRESPFPACMGGNNFSSEHLYDLIHIDIIFFIKKFPSAYKSSLLIKIRI